MDAPRFRLVVTLGPLLALLAACSTDKLLYPPSGSLTLKLVDGNLGEQTSSSPSMQAVRWTLDEAAIEIQGFGEYNFLGRSPCYATNNVIASTNVTNQCGGSPLSLASAGARAAKVRLGFSQMELRRAWRPTLPPDGDYDGDGIPNRTDNCPLVSNPDQESAGGSDHGVACSVLDPTTLLRIDPDTDADGLADAIDNCVWLANPDQSDSNGDGIGDDCSRTTRVLLDSQPLRFEPPPLSITLTTSRLATVVVDFDDAKTLFDCDPAMNVCRLDTSKVTASVR